MLSRIFYIDDIALAIDYLLDCFWSGIINHVWRCYRCFRSRRYVSQNVETTRIYQHQEWQGPNKPAIARAMEFPYRATFTNRVCQSILYLFLTCVSDWCPQAPLTVFQACRRHCFFLDSNMPFSIKSVFVNMCQ